MVYKINSLEDSANPGDGKITYRECALALSVTSPYQIPAGRPRYCVFEVSGAIELQSPAFIQTPHIYIAGQTSPGGIEFRLGANYAPADSLIDTRRGGDHAIIRHIRARLGEHPDRPSPNGDAIRWNSTNFQIADHVSAMFGTDESFEGGCQTCTVQWSIIGPNICRDAGHSSTSFHCKTFFFKPAKDLTLAYNLSQHGEQRGINIAPGSFPFNYGEEAQIDVIGNFVYNFVQESGLVSNQYAHPIVNYISNTTYEGPRFVTGGNGNFGAALYTNVDTFGHGFRINAQDNISPFNSSTADFKGYFGFFKGTTPGSVCNASNGLKDCSVTGLDVVRSGRMVSARGAARNWLQSWMLVDYRQAQRNVLSFAGADRCRDGRCRDNVDEMFIEDVQTCDRSPRLFESGWTSTVAATGGYARLRSTGGPSVDSDNDGMPDAWENQFSGTNANVWDANDDPDGDGYPNIEEYLNWLANDHTRYRDIYNSGNATLPPYNCGKPRR
ncbi:hypothetical protein ACI5KX_12235 [Erythrobacter sp. GH1-10]|uniref:hypothetical protein n=1 Tax=Erythrobacter sp. GH1-10 TaxID=3349334 RepID=UPI003877A388